MLSALLAVAMGACSDGDSPSEFTRAPDGVNQGDWDSYCGHSRELTRSLRAHAAGDLDDDAFMAVLGQHREQLERDSERMRDLGAEVEAIVGTIDRLRLVVNHEHGHGHGTGTGTGTDAVVEEPPLDDTEVHVAIGALPSCDKVA
jgi:hypothetical protein